MGLLALIAQALPGMKGSGITTPEAVAVACVLVILVVAPALVYWRNNGN
jgi:hypothetical protein